MQSFPGREFCLIEEAFKKKLAPLLRILTKNGRCLRVKGITQKHNEKIIDYDLCGCDGRISGRV